MSTRATPRHLQWPVERFYWAVIDASVLSSGWRPRREQLGFLFEPFVPQPLEELHVVYEPLADRRYLACAVDRAELQQELAAEIVTLTPMALPPFVECIGCRSGQPRYLGTRAAVARSRGQPGHSATNVLLLRQQPAAVSRLAGVSQAVPAADTNRVGQT